ncbi:MAG: hypothetical protein AVDCRST_MAG54-3811, partial [uncultured Actinomycetospora sp.]
ERQRHRRGRHHDELVPRHGGPRGPGGRAAAGVRAALARRAVHPPGPHGGRAGDLGARPARRRGRGQRALRLLPHPRRRDGAAAVGRGGAGRPPHAHGPARAGRRHHHGAAGPDVGVHGPPGHDLRPAGLVRAPASRAAGGRAAARHPGHPAGLAGRRPGSGDRGRGRRRPRRVGPDPRHARHQRRPRRRQRVRRRPGGQGRDLPDRRRPRLRPPGVPHRGAGAGLGRGGPVRGRLLLADARPAPPPAVRDVRRLRRAGRAARGRHQRRHRLGRRPAVRGVAAGVRRARAVVAAHRSPLPRARRLVRGGRRRHRALRR